ncbi:MAG: glycerate kinase, partial [Exiguobacterium mexicanum]
TNPLLGPMGAAAVFGTQKGLAKQDVVSYEERLSSYTRCFERDVTGEPGAGAAGGIGFALYQLGAVYVSGIEDVVRWSNLEETLQTVDWLITGEGHFDAQSLHGKAPYGLARLANAHGVPTLVFAGQSELIAVPDVGIEAVFSIVSRVMTLEEAMQQAAALLTDAVSRAFRLIDKDA